LGQKKYLAFTCYPRAEHCQDLICDSNQYFSPTEPAYYSQNCTDDGFDWLDHYQIVNKFGKRENISLKYFIAMERNSSFDDLENFCKSLNSSVWKLIDGHPEWKAIQEILNEADFPGEMWLIRESEEFDFDWFNKKVTNPINFGQ